MIDKDSILSETIEKNVFNVRLECDNAFVFTLSDLHIGLGSRQYIEAIVKFILSIPNAYVVVGGDLIDNPIKNSKGSVLECYADPQEQIKLAVEILKPLVDDKRILAIIGSGNHEDRTMKEAYISVTQIIATMLGISDLYVSEFAIGYITVNDNCYTYCNLHKHKKTKNYYSYFNVECLILEHTHEYSYEEKPVIYHNKFTKKPSVRSSYIINNGSALALPHYAKMAGYAMQQIGTYVLELSGGKRGIKIWRDIDLYDAINRGYK